MLPTIYKKNVAWSPDNISWMTSRPVFCNGGKWLIGVLTLHMVAERYVTFASLGIGEK